MEAAENAVERILVVPREKLFRDKKFTGFLLAGSFDFLKIIRENATFVERTEKLEKNVQLKQIIPYVIFLHDGKVFLYQRKSREMENRYAGLFSVGLGGHEKASGPNGDVMEIIEESIEREFGEEINYDGNKSLEFAGYVNFDHDVFNKVHFGLVYIAHCTTENIRGKDETESGLLLSVSEAKEKINEMEEWSKAVAENIL